MRESRAGRAAADPQHRDAATTAGLASVVDRVLGLLRSQRLPLESTTVRGVIDQLRHGAHDTPDPGLRAAVHVACAHLSAGNLDDAAFALSTAADILGRHRQR